MNRNGITKISVLLLGTAIIGWGSPAMAGFEFSAPSAPVKTQVAPEDAVNAPMPIVPTDPVTSEPLAAPGAPDVDHVLKTPVSYQAPRPAVAADPVYIRRQRPAVVMKAPKDQPMDTEALLKATEEGRMVELEGSPRPNLGAVDSAPADDGRLVINPYPLDSDKGAAHGGIGTVATEQAMMEEGGNLRAIAVPGKSNTSGMIARANITSRYDSSSRYLDRTPASEDAAMFGIAPSMTPIPGGEGAPLTQIAAAPMPGPAPILPAPRPPEAAPTQVSQSPVVSAPAENNGGYAEAVGFGRDLPLALALSQVVPADYSYAFSQQINAGSTVSWQGGKPWPDVLNDMLATQGLRAVISGKQVTIVPNGRSA